LTTEAATVLVVDDNAENLDLLSRRLARRGYTVLTASGGRAALTLLAQQTVDIILLDIMMPDVNGLDVLQWVRERHSASELPIIMVTARTDTADVVEALGMGANDYVTKPIEFAIVQARVEAQLRMHSGAARALRAAALARDAEPATIEVGRLIGGKYRLESLIGSGAFGSVYRARHLDLDQLVAVKVLQTAAARNPDMLERFQREGIAACRIRHLNAVSVMDFGVTSSGFAFLVMELLEGHSLEEELQRAGRVPLVRTAEILAPLCAVLAHAHASGIVHRDVKPANVFLQLTPQGEIVKMLDFGIARFVDDQATSRRLTVDGNIIGTPAYMAPERFRPGATGGAADVYSVGVMLYQMLAGRLPFPSDETDVLKIAMAHLSEEPPPLRGENPEVTPGVEAVVMQALRKDPAARPAPAALARDFLKALGMPRYRPGTFLTPIRWALPRAGAAAPSLAPTQVATGNEPPATEPLVGKDNARHPTRASLAKRTLEGALRTPDTAGPTTVVPVVGLGEPPEASAGAPAGGPKTSQKRRKTGP
jgi:serine/threonine protein kinase/CheY-like chemotaxis protein